MTPYSQLRTVELQVVPRLVKKRELRARLKALNGKYAPLFTFSQMRAIFEHEAFTHGGQIRRTKLSWNLDIPEAGTVLRFIRVDGRSWQQTNLCGW